MNIYDAQKIHNMFFKKKKNFWSCGLSSHGHDYWSHVGSAPQQEQLRLLAMRAHPMRQRLLVAWANPMWPSQSLFLLFFSCFSLFFRFFSCQTRHIPLCIFFQVPLTISLFVRHTYIIFPCTQTLYGR